MTTYKAFTRIQLPAGVATILPDMDFETRSMAGMVFRHETEKWIAPPGVQAKDKGLPCVGVAVYSEHPSTEVLSLAYNLKDGVGPRLWVPGAPAPVDLFNYAATWKPAKDEWVRIWGDTGPSYDEPGLIEAWNVSFEWHIWLNVCAKRYGWPALHIEQMRCAMAKARAFALAGRLEVTGNVLDLPTKKDTDGDRLLKKFSVPRNPTKKDRRVWIDPGQDPVDGPKLYGYNLTDIETEAQASERIPDLIPDELDFWIIDQKINARGVQSDADGVANCIAVLEQAYTKYNAELQQLTNGIVQSASELQRLQGWLGGCGLQMAAMDDEAITAALKLPLPEHLRRVLQIRKSVGSASVKKVYAMANQRTAAGRLCGMFAYHAARTGRAAGYGPQPQNLPNSGPEVKRCEDANCRKHFGSHHTTCPHCGAPEWAVKDKVEWNPDAVEDALATLATRSLEWLEWIWGDVVEVISACLRGLFIAAPGHDLISADYSAIEAVVLAALAGEEWRLEVFRTHGRIYEKSASAITGTPFEEFMLHKGYTRDQLARNAWWLEEPATKGKDHPLRKTLGKVAELASGYAGWIGAWKNFGADKFMNDDEIKKAIIAWREASPMIVEFWGGQFRGRPWDNDFRPELYGLEGCAVGAVSNPGQCYTYRGISYQMDPVGDVLYCRLLSGRLMAYHRPRLAPSTRGPGVALSFEGWNTNPNNGPVGWIRMDTYSGKLTENVVQATARDLLAFAIRNLEKAGYRVVMHVHDEIVAEVPEGWGSTQEFETIMATVPEWARGWPVKTGGAWRGKRFRK